jgi:hypothetical protein
VGVFERRARGMTMVRALTLPYAQHHLGEVPARFLVANVVAALILRGANTTLASA